MRVALLLGCAAAVLTGVALYFRQPRPPGPADPPAREGPQGPGSFADVTREAGLDNPAWGASAAFLDYDRDGRLDLVVVNYVDYDPTWPCTTRGRQEYCPPQSFPGQVTRLFRNRGPGRGTAV